MIRDFLHPRFKVSKDALTPRRHKRGLHLGLASVVTGFILQIAFPPVAAAAEGNPGEIEAIRKEMRQLQEDYSSLHSP